jgi:hypothetical protein
MPVQANAAIRLEHPAQDYHSDHAPNRSQRIQRIQKVGQVKHE